MGDELLDLRTENALLKGALKTVHLAGTFGGTNQEVANRIAELEYTHIQAKQYIEHAQQREHALAQAQESLAAARATLIEICDVVVYWNHDITGGEPAPFGGNYQKKHLEKCKRCQLDSILLPITVGYTVTPSDSTALANPAPLTPYGEALREAISVPYEQKSKEELLQIVNWLREDNEYYRQKLNGQDLAKLLAEERLALIESFGLMLADAEIWCGQKHIALRARVAELKGEQPKP